jgi:hypothetical protein
MGRVKKEARARDHSTQRVMRKKKKKKKKKKENEKKTVKVECGDRNFIVVFRRDAPCRQFLGGSIRSSGALIVCV